MAAHGQLHPDGISIHAPVKGATRVQRHRVRRCHQHFNPRSREGSDLLEFSYIRLDTIISIHAPVKGATAE